MFAIEYVLRSIPLFLVLVAAFQKLAGIVRESERPRLDAKGYYVSYSTPLGDLVFAIYLPP